MVHNPKSLVVVLFCLSLIPLAGQETHVFLDAQKDYKDGLTFYKKGLYPQAYIEFGEAIEKLTLLSDPKAPTLLAQAELGQARCAIRTERPEGEVMALNFVRKYSPDPIADEALVEVGNYYFNARDYKKALNFFERADISALPRKLRSEINFKIGYSYFVQKDFEKAKNHFTQTANTVNQYYYPTNYYLGLCHFFQGDYETALTHLNVAAGSSSYDDYVPFYVAEIMFAQRKYSELVQYVEPQLALESTRLKKVPELNQLLGQSYFELGEYRKALPYLEYYEEETSRLREEEFYQLAYTQYKTGNYQKAIRNFEELSTVDGKLGQHAMFYLADSYLKTGNKTSAWTAMGKARKLKFDPVLHEEALFNYAKLSYEVRAYGEASSALQEMSPQSSHYQEGQELLGKIFLSYRDYEQALEVLRGMENPTPEMKATYHKILLYRGIQLLDNKDYPRSREYFQQTANLPYDPPSKAMASYWLGEIAHRQEQYDASISYVNQFMREASGMADLPPQSSMMTANYLQGYNFLKKGDFPGAARYFSEAVKTIELNRRFLGESRLVDQVLGDATIRAGDSYLEQNQFNEALYHYNNAISKRYPGFEYALYQKALVEGLRDDPTDKLLALEQIANNYPQSPWADDALFQLGSTYQRLNRLQQAIPPLEKLTTQYRNTSDLINQGLIKLGLIYYNMGNTQRAISYYKQVVTNNPTTEENGVALAALQEIYVEDLSRPDEYLAFLQSIGQDVSTVGRDSVTFRSADIQYQSGNYDRAIQAFSTYLQQFPTGRYRLEAHFKRAESFGSLQNWGPALADYEAVVNMGNSRYYQEALTKAAIIAYNHAQDFRKSLQLYTQLEQTVLSSEQKFEAQLGALRSAYRMPDPIGVRTWASKVATNPSASNQERAMAQFYLGKLAYDQRDYATATAAFNDVIQNSDNEQTAEARYLLANIYFQQGQLDRAQQLCINSNRESSGHPYWVAKSVVLLSDVFVRKGDYLNAQAALEALLENYRGDQQIIQEANSKLQAINQRINEGSRLDQGAGSEFMDNSGNGQ